MSWRLLLLGLLAFVVALVVVLPARWIGGVLPSDVRCAQWSGTLWRGSCAQLAVQLPGKSSVMVETTTWVLHPMALLRGRAAAEVTITDARGEVAGHVEFGRGNLLILRGVSIRARFDPQLPIAMPQGWRGRADIQQLELEMKANQLLHLQGDFGFHDLRDEDGQDLGSYRVVFPAATDPPFKGQISDAGGPLELHGTLQLFPDRRWSLDGKVAPRAGTHSGIARNLEILGAPDSAGRYPLSATGSFR